jgi:transcriptional regulator with XRE-family HTH domain
MTSKLVLPGGTFAVNLTAAREAHNWSVAELAKRADLNESAIYRLQHGQRQPTLPAILRLADALGMTGSDLIEGVTA